MSGTAEPDHLSTHEYFRTIEEVFVELRGAPLLLSPKDWQTAREWHREGIPLDLVLRTLEELFERRREQGDEDRIGSLRYCNRAVRSAWKRVRELTGAAADRGGAGTPTAEPAVDPEERLAALARALPERLPGREEVAGRILALADAPGPEPARASNGPEARGPGGRERQIEAALAQLDRELLERLIGALSADRRNDLEQDALQSLGALTDRLPREDIARAVERLVAQKVRRLHRLPTLSLFAPEARPEDSH